MDFEEFHKRAQDARKRKITTEQLREWGRKSAKTRLAGKSTEEIKEYFRKVRRGEKINV